MATITRFEDIKSWQTARALTKRIYLVSRQGEFARDFSFRDQIRRSSVSVMDNIAEGFESRTNTQFLHYLGQAKASCGEFRSQLYVALDVEYIDQQLFQELRTEAEKCSGQIARFMDYLERRPASLRVREAVAEYVVDPVD